MHNLKSWYIYFLHNYYIEKYVHLYIVFFCNDLPLLQANGLQDVYNLSKSSSQTCFLIRQRVFHMLGALTEESQALTAHLF